MREIAAGAVSLTVARLFKEANYEMGGDVIDALEKARREETSPRGREVIGKILDNAGIAASEQVALCQDCGAAVVFIEIGQEVHVGGDLTEAVNEGVRKAYTEGYLRKSMAARPFTERKNTGDNTPAIIHTEVVPGDKMKITVMPKGAGAENMTRLGMLLPADGREGVVDMVANTVEAAGSKACPPLVIGVGIGGTAEKALLLAKQALRRPTGQPSPDAENAALEQEILDKVNGLGIGPMGYGGNVTALAVHVESFPAHIGSLPVAVNLNCHCARHKEAVL